MISKNVLNCTTVLKGTKLIYKKKERGYFNGENQGVAGMENGGLHRSKHFTEL